LRPRGKLECFYMEQKDLYFENYLGNNLSMMLKTI